MKKTNRGRSCEQKRADLKQKLRQAFCASKKTGAFSSPEARNSIARRDRIELQPRDALLEQDSEFRKVESSRVFQSARSI